MALHYFPKLGAEFFLVEDERLDAGARGAGGGRDAAGDRIEEGARLRVGGAPCRQALRRGVRGARFREVPAAPAMADRTWFYDSARKNLHVRVRVAAGADSIVNLEP